jgi:LmbE family N-acetylglucosaminyl deacetylase
MSKEQTGHFGPDDVHTDLLLEADKVAAQEAKRPQTINPAHFAKELAEKWKEELHFVARLGTWMNYKDGVYSDIM